VTDKHEVVESALKLMYGFRSTQVTYVIAKLGLADQLADGPLTAIELASRGKRENPRTWPASFAWPHGSGLSQRYPAIGSS